jgi:hypothetical protein
MSDKGKVLQGDEVPKNKRMMEEGGTVEPETVASLKEKGTRLSAYLV